MNAVRLATNVRHCPVTCSATASFMNSTRSKWSVLVSQCLPTCPSFSWTTTSSSITRCRPSTPTTYSKLAGTLVQFRPPVAAYCVFGYRPLIIRLEARPLQPNIGFTLRRVLAVYTRSAITLRRKRTDLDKIWSTVITLSGAGLGRLGARDPHSSDSWRARRIFVR